MTVIRDSQESKGYGYARDNHRSLWSGSIPIRGSRKRAGASVPGSVIGAHGSPLKKDDLLSVVYPAHREHLLNEVSHHSQPIPFTGEGSIRNVLSFAGIRIRPDGGYSARQEVIFPLSFYSDTILTLIM
jgi:hypothetical protein